MAHTRATRRALPILILLILAAVSALLAFTARDLPQTDRAAAYARDVSVSASATYVTLRTLNAFLSSAQELEVTGSVVFASGSAQPLKVLEPIDDTVERVAAVVFWVMLTAGVLAVTMGPLGTLGFALLSLACVASAAVMASGRRGLLGGAPRLLASYGLFLGLGVPLAFLLSAATADMLTRSTWADHAEVLAQITGAVDMEVPEDEGFGNPLDQIERYRQLGANIATRADELVGSLVGLLSVYIFKLVVLPMLVTGALLLVARRLAGGRRAAR